MTVKQARKTMADAFKKDPGFRESYVANVAILLSDRYGMKNHVQRNNAANDILKRIFES